MFLISPAFAQDAAAATTEAAGPGLVATILPLILVFFVFYAMVIRPQNKRLMDHRKTIESLQKGDKVITGGGLIATVKRLQGDDEVVLEIASGVEVTALRNTIMSVKK